MKHLETILPRSVLLVAGLFAPALMSAVASPPITDKAAYIRGLSALQTPHVGAQDVTNGSANIEFVMDDNGKFTIGTRIGDPRITTDDNLRLLYGHPSPSTSDTMIEIDGVRTSLHSGTPSAIVTNGTSSSVDITFAAGIRVTQTLAVINSQGTSLPGAIRVHFRVTNIDSSSHDIRLRTQLDTMLGNNDGAPFRLPSFDPITSDREFDDHAVTGSIPDIPPAALVFDNLDNPNIVAEFGFVPVGFPKPDRLVFGQWGVSVGQWDYTIVPGRNLTDSSVILWWGYDGGTYDNAYTLAPGDSQEFAFDYGIGNSCTFLPGSPFSMILCSPLELEGEVIGSTFRYSPDPALISAFLSNTSGVAIAGARATLNLTPGLQLLTGEEATQPVETTTPGLIEVDGSDQLDWSMLTNARVLGPRQFSVVVDGGGGRSVIARGVNIKTIPNAVYGQATDSQGTPIGGASITIYRGSAVVGSLTTQSDGTYALGGLDPGPYRVRLQVPGMPESWFAANAAAPGENGSTGNPTAFSDPVTDFRVRAYPNPVRDGPVRIAFSSTVPATAEVKIFDAAGRTIKTMPLDAPGPGWHETEWEIADVANGVYFYQVESNGTRKVGRIAVLKRKP